MPRMARSALLCAALLLFSACAKTNSNSAPVEKSESIVWMSDTQNYAEHYPEILRTMTDWIVQNRSTLGIQYVIHTGDFVNDIYSAAQWQAVKSAFAPLQSKLGVFSAAGNHDIGGADQNYDAYLQLFGPESFEGLSTYGGCYLYGRGRYDLLEISGKPFLLLSMGYGMSDEAIAWMDKVLKQYPDRNVILCLHGYESADGVLTSDGNKIEPLVQANPNIVLVLCGHRHGVFRRADFIDADKNFVPEHIVGTLLADYQDEENGGNGYLCILTFSADAQNLKVSTYSPYLNDFDCYDNQPGLEEFTVRLNLVS